VAEGPTRYGAFNTCGVRIDAVTLGEAVDRVRSFASLNEGRAVHLCNAYTLSRSYRDPVFASILNAGDLNLPDGMPLAWIGRRVGFTHMHDRVAGPDLMLATIRAGRPSGLRHYLYGGSPPVAQALCQRLLHLAPGVRIVGVESPPFRELTPSEETALTIRIGSTRPDIVWVGLGTPRQDLFTYRFRNRLGVTLIAVGAAFDFISGAKRQAPPWMQRRGLEWLFRLVTEPRRLWRRYLVGNAVFLAGVAKGVQRTPPLQTTEPRHEA
jgi:N-acetylglucosaminyldiphosphoundecaprenol N-acetyl-beta-D-mannosaminyltransferase